MSDTVQQIKDRLSIADVVGGYVKLERAGQNMRARCPFHAERTPSFMISPERGTYHCFGCGVGGDIFSFVEAIEGLDFKGALRVLAERAGVKIEYGNRDETDARDRLLSLMEAAAVWYAGRLGSDQEKYLHDRGLSGGTIRSFRIGWAGNGWDDLVRHLRDKRFSDKEMIDAGVAKKNERGAAADKFRNRIMFPLADSAGRVIAFSGRSFGPDASPEAPKYLNSPETMLFHKSRVLYGFDKAKMAMRKLNCAVLVEGQVDLVMSHQAGWENAVAVSGTAFTEEHAALIKRMTENLIICLDADQAGFKAAGKSARAALRSGMKVKVAQLPNGLDPADLITAEGPGAFKEVIKAATDIITFLLDVIAKADPPRDRFLHNVETIVIPFLRDVQSPVDKDRYILEIENRTGIMRGAITEALARLPEEPDSALPEERSRRSPRENPRLFQILCILFWQESLKAPVIDTRKLRSDLEALKLPTALAEGEKDRYIFEAERLYAGRPPQEDADALFGALRKDALAQELKDVTWALRKAEEAQNEAEVQRLLDRSRLLTTEIAKSHASR